jgi:hypothetical protein
MQLNGIEVISASPHFANGKKTTAVDFKLNDTDKTMTTLSAEDIGLLINTRRLVGYEGVEDPIIESASSIDEPIDQQKEEETPVIPTTLGVDGTPKKVRKEFKKNIDK